MVLLKRVSPGYLRVWVKINKEIPGFSDAGGREASVRGQDAKSKINVIGRSEKPNKDTTGFWEESVYFAKKKNPSFMHFFFLLHRELWDVGSRQQGGRRQNDCGGGSSRKRGWRKACLQHLSLGWRVFYLHPLRVPEIINMCCHSCFSSGDFIQSL